MHETTIHLNIEPVENGGYVATSPDVPGLVAEGRSIREAVEIAQGLVGKLIESCLEHGDPLPPALAHCDGLDTPVAVVVPVSVPQHLDR